MAKSEKQGSDEHQKGILDWLDSKQRVVKTATLIHDPQVGAGLADAELAKRLAGIMLQQKPEDEGRGAEYEKAEALVAQLKADIKGVSREFKFRNLPPDEYDALERAHRATAEIIEEAKATARAQGQPPRIPDLDEVEFSKSLVAAASFDPVLTRETVVTMWSHENMTAGERNALFQAAMAANTHGA